MQNMIKYIFRRIVAVVIMIFLVMTVNFFLIHAAPGGPATVMTGLEFPSKEIIEALNKQYGLDKPIAVQYLEYMGNLLRGNLGYSYIYNESSWNLIAGRIFPTLILTITSSVLAFVIGVYMAIFVSRLRNKYGELSASLLSYILYAVPSFWLALIMIIIFSSDLKLFPTSGMLSLRYSYSGIEGVIDFIHHLVLPVSTLTLIQIPVFYRITRTSIVQNQGEDYITTLTAIGVPKEKLFRKYVMKNAIVPPLNIFGILLGFSITGTVILERVFAWPGMGRLMLDTISRRDYQLLLGIYFLMALFISVAMFVTDILIAFLDPRVRLT
jgi:peptide/nickel transport system permease protein